jgi:hypothetical protein
MKNKRGTFVSHDPEAHRKGMEVLFKEKVTVWAKKKIDGIWHCLYYTGEDTPTLGTKKSYQDFGWELIESQ